LLSVGWIGARQPASEAVKSTSQGSLVEAFAPV